MNEARAVVYRILSRLFCSPEKKLLEDLLQADFPALFGALEALGADGDLVGAARRLSVLIAAADLDDLQTRYHNTFEPSGGLRCPPNETSHTPETPQEAMTRSFELADIAGFYRAFGVEVTPGTERVDHITAELEFMHLLATKEAVAEAKGEGENVKICRDAGRSFVRDHLGRWSAKFCDCLEKGADGAIYAAAGRLLKGFVEFDAAEIGAS